MNPNDPTGSGQVYGTSTGGDAIGAVITAAAGLYDSHQNRKAARENTDKTIAAQKAEAELAYQRAVEMWHMQNAYNSPQAQMQRFIDAGLNPHLIYGRGSSGEASAPPAYNAPHIQYKYAAGSHGAAVQTILPTLMALGTWKQNMKLMEMDYMNKQADINLKVLNAEKQAQAIDQAYRINPLSVKEKGLRNDRLIRELRKFDYEFNELLPSQASALRLQNYNTAAGITQRLLDTRYQYGDDATMEPLRYLGYGTDAALTQPLHGMSQLERKRAVKELELMGLTGSIAEKNLELLSAKSMFAEYGITDPQGLLESLVSSGGSLVGRFGSAALTRTAMNRRSRRLHPSRRVQYPKSWYD